MEGTIRNWVNSGYGSRTPKDKDCPPFFIADKAGTIFFADDSGHCSESLTTQSPVNLMFYHEARDLLLLLTEDLLFSHYLLNQDGKLILDTAVILYSHFKSLF